VDLCPPSLDSNCILSKSPFIIPGLQSQGEVFSPTVVFLARKTHRKSYKLDPVQQRDDIRAQRGSLTGMFWFSNLTPSIFSSPPSWASIAMKGAASSSACSLLRLLILRKHLHPTNENQNKPVSEQRHQERGPSRWTCCSETFQLKASQAESGAEPRVGQAQKEEYPLIHPVTHSCNQHTQTGWALRSRRCFPVQTEQRHTRPRPPRTPWTELGLAMYSQKLLFSLRCPLELFGLYRSLVCRIYLGTCPWAPCRSRHPPGGRLVWRQSERMERWEEEAVSICQEEQATPCVSFWRKCSVLRDLSEIYKWAILPPKSKPADSQTDMPVITHSLMKTRF